MKLSTCILRTTLPIALLAPFGLSVAAGENTFELNSQQKVAVNKVISSLEQKHIESYKFDAEFARRVIEKYVKTIDYSRSLVTQPELDAYVKRADAVAKRDFTLLTEVWNHRSERFEEKMKFWASLGAKSMDFTLEESFQPSPALRERPVDQQAQRELWRKEFKFSVLLEAKSKQWLTKELLKKHLPQLVESVIEEEREYAVNFQDQPSYFKNVMRAIVKSYDSNSSFYPPTSGASSSLKSLGLKIAYDDSAIRVKEVIDPGPSVGCGLKANDLIIGVTEEGTTTSSLVGISPNLASTLLESKDNVAVELFCVRDLKGDFQHKSVSIRMSIKSLKKLPDEGDNNFEKVFGVKLKKVDGFYEVAGFLPHCNEENKKTLKVGDRFLASHGGHLKSGTLFYDSDKVEKFRAKKLKLIIQTAEMKNYTVAKIKVTTRKFPASSPSSIKASSVVKTIDSKNGPCKVGVIHLPSFYYDHGAIVSGQSGANSYADVKNELVQLMDKNVDALVLDLRDNPGGSTLATGKILSLFLPNKLISCRSSKKGSKNLEKSTLYNFDKNVSYDGALVVLMNEESASAAEMFSGTVQDYARGVIVGSARSWGKGIAQTYVSLERGGVSFGELWCTDSRFYRADGSSCQEVGVQSDIVLPSFVDDSYGMKANEFHITQGEPVAAVSLEIAGKKFDPCVTLNPAVFSSIDQLKQRSAKRRALSADFKDLDTGIKQQKILKRSARPLEWKAFAEYYKQRKERDQQITKVLGFAPRKMGTNKKLVDNLFLEEAIAVAADMAELKALPQKVEWLKIKCE